MRRLKGNPVILRWVSIAMAIAAAIYAAMVVRQSRHFDDGGPPLGTMCIAIPAFVLVIAAGLVWSMSRKSK